MEGHTLSLVGSPFAPVAIGFFGPGAGYFVRGGQALSYTTAIHLALGSRA